MYPRQWIIEKPHNNNNSILTWIYKWYTYWLTCLSHLRDSFKSNTCESCEYEERKKWLLIFIFFKIVSYKKKHCQYINCCNNQQHCNHQSIDWRSDDATITFKFNQHNSRIYDWQIFEGKRDFVACLSYQVYHFNSDNNIAFVCTIFFKSHATCDINWEWITPSIQSFFFYIESLSSSRVIWTLVYNYKIKNAHVRLLQVVWFSCDNNCTLISKKNLLKKEVNTKEINYQFFSFFVWRKKKQVINVTPYGSHMIATQYEYISKEIFYNENSWIIEYFRFLWFLHIIGY